MLTASNKLVNSVTKIIRHTARNKIGGSKGQVVGYFQGVVPMFTQVQLVKHSG